MNFMQLTEEQAQAYEQIEMGQNVFLTGRAGTGKSFILQAIYKAHACDGVTAFVAPTGIAARNLGGVTIHSFFGLPCMPFIDASFQPSSSVIGRLRACERLIVDEISMVRSDILTEMDRRMRLAKDKDKPFGGCQIVVCGDFHQLPPVVEDQLVGESLYYYYGGVFAFETEAWRLAGFSTFVLKQQIRQAEDPPFLAMLNAIRENRPGIMQAIDNLNKQVKSREDGIPALCCRREEVCAINQARLAALAGSAVRFHARVQILVSPDEEPIWKELHDLPCDEEIVLKRGCEVMVLRNLPGGCVNGDRGVVESWTPDSVSVRLQYNKQALSLRRVEWPIFTYCLDMDGKLKIQHIASVWQFPLALGYATTIHKAQGSTLARAHIDIGRGCWESGQLYVALSRVRHLADLTLERPVNYCDVAPTALVDRLNRMGY